MMFRSTISRTAFPATRGLTNVLGTPYVAGQPIGGTDFAFGEGWTSSSFSGRYILSNPCATSNCAGTSIANVVLTFYDSGGNVRTANVTVPAGQMTVFDVGQHYGAGFSNSAVVTSDTPILAERLVSFNFAGPGATEVPGAPSLGQYFVFPEGWTGSTFSDFLAIGNPDSSRAAVLSVIAFRSDGAVQVYTVTAPPHSRSTVSLNSLVGGGVSFSTIVESSVPVVMERSIYFNWNGNEPGGSDVIGYQP